MRKLKKIAIKDEKGWVYMEDRAWRLGGIGQTDRHDRERGKEKPTKRQIERQTESDRDKMKGYIHCTDQSLHRHDSNISHANEL